MKLLTKEIENQMPKLYSQEKDSDPMVYVKFFCPWNEWKWFATEYEDGEFFGFVVGDEPELGYFTLEEMESVTGPAGLKIERDIAFTPCRLSAVKKSLNL